MQQVNGFEREGRREKIAFRNGKLRNDQGNVFSFSASLQNPHSSLVSSNLPSRGRITLLQLINGKREKAEKAIL